MTSRNGKMLARSILRSERCVMTSKARIDSTSSPKNSTRIGSSAPNGYTSRIPPRMLNCPTLSTICSRSKPAPTRVAATSSISATPPTVSEGVASSRMYGGIVGSKSARMEVTTTAFSPASRLSSASIRRPVTSKWGDRSSYGGISQAGK